MADNQFQDNVVLQFPVDLRGDAGGGGTMPPMDTAARLDAMDGRLTRVELKLDLIEHEVSGLKWWLLGSVITIIITVIATVVGTGIGIQQMTVATFQAAAQPAQPAPQPTVIVVPAAAVPASK